MLVPNPIKIERQVKVMNAVSMNKRHQALLLSVLPSTAFTLFSVSEQSRSEHCSLGCMLHLCVIHLV